MQEKEGLQIILAALVTFKIWKHFAVPQKTNNKILIIILR